MTVCWTRPQTDGGSEIASYIVEKRDRAGVRWTKCNKRRVTDLRFRVTGLTEDHEYEFRLSAENAAGVGQPSPPTVYYKACDPTFKPGPPTNAHVVDTTKNSVTVEWSRPIYDGGLDIQGYVVEICKADEEEWITCTPPTGLNATKFKITKLTEHQEYKVQICALNRLGVGEPIALTGTVKPVDKMDPPEIELDAELRKGIVVRAGGSMRINIPFKGRPTPEINWTKDDGDLPSKAQIEKGLNYTQLSIDICDRNDAGKYTLNLENSSGSKSAFVSVKVLDTPGAPLNLTVKDITRNYVTLLWEPPLIDGGAKIKNYIVDKRESTRPAFSNITTKCTKTTLRVGDLTEGGIYYFRVMAENEFGVGLPIETEESVKTADPPLPVGKVTLVDVTKSTASLSWEKPDHDGGSRILGYYIEMQPKGSEDWVIAATTKTCEGTVTGLAKSQEYLFRVSAFNEKGRSDPRPLAAPVTAKDITIEPSFKITCNTFSVQCGEDLKVEIPVKGRPAPKVTWTKDGQALKETTRLNVSSTFTITDLTEGDRYEFRVIARNAAGILSEPSESTGPITAQDEIEAPSVSMESKFKDVIIVNAGDTFTIDADIAGKPLPDIMWLKDGKEIDSATPRMEIKSTITRTILTVKDCIRVDGGHFVLSLSNVGGTKQVPVNVKVLDRPGPPDGPLKVTGVRAEKCYLHWSHPTHDGGASISHYIIEKRETSRLSWTMVEPKIQAISYKVTKLLPGNEYIFRVMAVNKYGIGEPLESDPVLAKNPFKTPGPPSTPEASAITRDSMVLTWERPEDDGGSQIEGYVLEKRDKEGVRWTKCNRKRLTDLRFRAAGLTEGHSYEFRVSAENAAGVGTPSEPSEYYKACDAIYPPGPPSNPKVTDYSSTAVTIAWSRPIYDGGAPISGYIVEKKEASDDEWIVCTPHTGVQGTHFTVKKLKENAEYNFRVCAFNIEGAGDHADVPGSVIAAEKMEAPEVELDADLRKMVNVRASATLRLFVTIRGRPEPEVKWTKAEGTLTERAQIEVTSSYTMLVIDNVDRFDTGKYVVTLENNSGTKSAFVNVRVLDSPSAPVNFVVKDVKRDSVQLQWEPPHIDGGAKITHYIVEKRESKRMAFTTVSNNCVRNSFKVDDLQEGGVYHFRVLAVNELGVGLPVSTTEPVKVSQAPLPPGKVTLVDVTRHSVSLSWEKPDHDGRPHPEVVWKKDAHSLKQTTRVNVLTSKTSSKISQLIFVALFSAIPEAPSTPWVTAVTRESITVSWKEPASDGGSHVFGYHLQMKDKNSILWKKVNKTVIRATHFKVTDVSPGLIYEFKVAAENAAGIGPISKISDAVLAIDACGEYMGRFRVRGENITYQLKS
uniref:Titin n=1 Tax=Astyanax mexicanus TaxID=7994 RepID=A0A3B1J086_ASTMX